jgi:hypothetical protein
MSKSNKYNASGVWHDLETGEELLAIPTETERKKNQGRYHYFHSNLEYEVFLMLQSIYPLKQINLQTQISLKPETDIFPAITWTIDFTVSEGTELIYIEAKGYGTREFKLKLAMLEYFHPHIYKSFLLVFPTKKSLEKTCLGKTKGVTDKAVSFKEFKKIINHGSLYSALLRLESFSESKRKTGQTIK